jgi:(S)-2-hydroxy-acid oxidase
MTTGVASPLSSNLRAPSELIGWAGANVTEPEEGTSLINLHDFEVEAKARLPKPVFDYYAGGAEDGRALERNRQAFGWVHVCPRVLVDVSSVSTTCRLLDRSLASPILIAPTAMHKLAHAEG